MKITDIAIHAGGIDQPYKTLGEITAKVSKASLFSSSRTIEDVNFKLQEEASALGANAVINVSYSRGMSLMSKCWQCCYSQPRQTLCPEC